MHTLTPMAILKNKLDDLFLVLPSNFSLVSLNKSSPKNYVKQNVDDEYLLQFPNEESNFSVFSSKEIKSDFIKLFKAKSKSKSISLGFHFNYINKEQKDFSLSISMKSKDKNNNEKFFMSSPFSIQESKTLLDNSVFYFKSNPNNIEYLFDYFQNLCSSDKQLVFSTNKTSKNKLSI